MLFLQFLLAADPQSSLHFSTVEVPLPGAEGAVSLDYLAADRTSGRVWIPAGNTGSVDVLDVASRKVTRIEGFTTRARETRGGTRVMGPSAVAIGDGVAFIGNRATAEICGIEVRKLAKIACVELTSPTDGVAYVPSTKEVWVTMPRDESLTLVDASDATHLRQAARIALPGKPEGYAVDSARGWFFTNLEDKDKTVVIDVKSRKVMKTWNAGCGSDGPRGLAYDQTRRFLFVACTDKVEVLDAGHDGAVLAQLDTGAGVDNIDYLETKQNLFVAAGKAARLTVAHVGAGGKLVTLGTAPTAEGARVVVVARDGTAVVADPMHGRVLMISPQH
jgi:DNA-binding beta-propeller fold protein YncE